MKEVGKSIKEPLKESLKVEKQVSGSQNWDELTFPNWDNTKTLELGSLLGVDDMIHYGKEFNKLNSEYRAYAWDRIVASSTLDHQTGYMSEDIHGICTRTIKECDNQISRIALRMVEISKEVNGE